MRPEIQPAPDSSHAAESSPGGEALLRVRDLNVEVPTGRSAWTRLVEGVSFDVRRGETVGLVGESGSGKTVTSLALMGLLPPNTRVQGSVMLGDDELIGMSRRQLDRVRGARVSMIFQEPRRSLNPVFTVGEQVAESIRRHSSTSRKAAWRRTVELFDLVRISDPAARAKQYPHEFSGGMCQRVMIAMALAADPEILIADEPTTALDVTVQRDVLQLLSQVQGDLGLGILLITHDLGVIAEVVDRAMVMYAGEVVESAPVSELFDRPGHPYTAGLQMAMPDPRRGRERLSAIRGTVPAPGTFEVGCRFLERCDFGVEACADAHPPLAGTAPGHAVRCIRTREINLAESPHA